MTFYLLIILYFFSLLKPPAMPLGSSCSVKKVRLLMTTSHLYLHHLYDVLVGALHGKTQQQV